MKKVIKSSKKGFTLVELIVVLVILAILAAMLVPALVGYIDRAKKEKEYQAASTVYAAAQALATEAYGKDVKKADLEAYVEDTDAIKTLTGVEVSSIEVTFAGDDADIDGYTIKTVKILFKATDATKYTYTVGATTWGTETVAAANP